MFKVYITNIKELYSPPFKGLLYVQDLTGYRYYSDLLIPHFFRHIF